MDQRIYYNNIKNLLKADIKLDYTPEQIQEIMKCQSDIKYFLKTYVKIISLDKGIVNFNMFEYQERFIDILKNNNRIVALQPRQTGKSITSSAFILHYAIFNPNSYIAILANKARTARPILNKIKNMYRSLPIWLQVGVEEWSKGSIVLGNGTQLIAEATTESGIRGDSAKILFIDETGFIDNNLWDGFWSSVYPVVSSSKDAKIILSSTPHGINHFHKIWAEAKEGINGFTPFRAYWNEHPERDDAWKEKTILEIGETRWRVEFECAFQGSSGTLISGQKLESIPFSNPIKTKMENKFLIYEEPKDKRKYVLISDFGEGLGAGDYTTCHVIDVTEATWHQVAVYRDNEILFRETPSMLSRIGKYYNNALIIGEANTIGLGILDDLNFDEEYENIFFGDDLAKETRHAYFGMKMTSKTKKMGNQYLKEYVENDTLVVYDHETIAELSTYIKRKESYSAEDGKHDDLVTPLVLFSNFMQNKNYVEEWLGTPTYNKRDQKMSKLDEEIMPLGFHHDGETLINLDDGDDEDDYIENGEDSFFLYDDDDNKKSDDYEDDEDIVGEDDNFFD